MIERYFKYLFCIVVVISTCCSCSNTREKLLVSGCGWKQVAILDKKTGEIEWSHPLNKGEDCNDVEITREGNILYAYTSRIIELDPQGHPVEEIKFDTSITGVHDQFRQIVKTPQNTYLIPLMGKGEVVEMTKEKEIINRVECGGNPFAIQILKNGNWLVSCGDAHNFVEIAPAGKQIVRKVGSDDLQNISLLFVAELATTTGRNNSG